MIIVARTTQLTHGKLRENVLLLENTSFSWWQIDFSGQVHVS